MLFNIDIAQSNRNYFYRWHDIMTIFTGDMYNNNNNYFISLERECGRRKEMWTVLWRIAHFHNIKIIGHMTMTWSPRWHEISLSPCFSTTTLLVAMWGKLANCNYDHGGDFIATNDLRRHCLATRGFLVFWGTNYSDLALSWRSPTRKRSQWLCKKL